MPTPIASSFRDPSGFLFTRAGVLYRQINEGYRAAYDRLIESGLYDELSGSDLLVPHSDVTSEIGTVGAGWKVIRPQPIPFVSYPYEWCFGQLKAAALHTLAIQKRAVARGMTLKDASAYNIQFDRFARPVLIDTLSFAIYEEGRPWVAYRQFCQHFLAPLALMSMRDVRLGRLLATWIDGVPLGVATGLLPKRSWLSFALVTHLHLHARMQERYGDSGRGSRATPRLARTGFLALLENLEGAVRDLEWNPRGTEWGDYYEATNYTAEGERSKREFVAQCLDRVAPSGVWDLGGNVGVFSRLASARGIPTVCFDVDLGAVEKNYRAVRANREADLLPLALDLTSPSAAIGWANGERMSLAQRGPVDMAFALALLHHLAISNNVPLVRIAEYFASLCRWLVIEFVPKTDSQVQRLLASREDVFPDYDQSSFVAQFSGVFDVRSSSAVKGSERVLFLMQRKGDDR